MLLNNILMNILLIASIKTECLKDVHMEKSKEGKKQSGNEGKIYINK